MFNEENYAFAATPPEVLKSPWWIGHIPFAMELVKRLEPETLVELGTYSGSSLFAFCRAAELRGLTTKCHGVDLWEGDIHMGRFEESLFEEISRYTADRFPDSAVLVRKLFDDAAQDFADGSIDLLHIDGTHTLEAVSNDYHTWLPKMSERGVVLFHDTNVTREMVGDAAKDFGVREFFDSVKGDYPHLEFNHCYGLGVLVVGERVPKAVTEMLEDARDPEFHEYFERLGADVSSRFEKEEVQRKTEVAIREQDPKKVRAIAFYFPQFHAIPENDEWWGKGFTDWVNIKKAQPLFDGHNQPRVPLNENYYDQSQKEVISSQIELASRYGLGGFCHYHYWFEGKQLLQKPTDIFLNSPELKFPFCLAWANETWSRRWDGRDHHILIQQAHTPDASLWLDHFNYLIRAWTDERAIRVDGRPLFLIYRPQNVVNLEGMLEFWREKAVERGLPGLFVVAIKQYELPDNRVYDHFDAVTRFQPFEAIWSPDFPRKQVVQNRFLQRLRALPEPMQSVVRSVRHAFQKPTFFDYDQVWKHMLQVKQERGLPTFFGAFMDWDNTARYGRRATIFRGVSPERFEYWFRKLVETVAHQPEGERLVFVNAWNEWAEGTYLEPDERTGYRYLEALQRGLEAADTDTEALDTTSSRVSYG
ncbi:MAG: glycoside hydrolase family 99-like domain-containing protein [Pseudomonadota bacterium]